MSRIDLAKITALKYGEVDATGVMQTTLTTLKGVLDGSATVSIPAPETTKYYKEESAMPVYSIGGNIPDPSIELNIIGEGLQTYAALSGNTYAAADASDPETVTLSGSDTSPFKAFQLEGLTGDGTAYTIQIPKAVSKTSWDGSLGKGSMLNFGLMIDIVTPVNASNEEQPYMFITQGTATT